MIIQPPPLAIRNEWIRNEYSTSIKMKKWIPHKNKKLITNIHTKQQNVWINTIQENYKIMRYSHAQHRKKLNAQDAGASAFGSRITMVEAEGNHVKKHHKTMLKMLELHRSEAESLWWATSILGRARDPQDMCIYMWGIPRRETTNIKKVCVFWAI